MVFLVSLKNFFNKSLVGQRGKITGLWKVLVLETYTVTLTLVTQGNLSSNPSLISKLVETCR